MLRSKILVGLALLLPLAAAGCGDDTEASKPIESQALAQALEQPRDCLVDAGASLAQSSDEIEFFHVDYSRGRTDNPAGAGLAGVEVAEHAPVITTSGGPEPPPSYLVWGGEPAATGDTNPVTLADDDRAETFVAYIRNPTRAQIKRAQQCLDEFGTGTGTG
jgi:hypothetical protein